MKLKNYETHCNFNFIFFILISYTIYGYKFIAWN